MKPPVPVVASLLLGVWLPTTTPARAITPELVVKLVPDDGTPHDHFGSSLAVDGDTAFIGGNHGSAYVYVRSDGTWTRYARLFPSGDSGGFGHALTLQGDTALIGADLDGSTYVFTQSAEGWTEQTKLMPSGDGGGFGNAVALDQGTALIGAPWDDDDGSNAGAVYVFTRAGDSWTEQARLSPADAAAGDFFGGQVALDGDTAFVSAWIDFSNADAPGSVYVFTRAAAVWTERAKLLASDGAPGDFFGSSLALEGDVALIGAYHDDDDGLHSGSAYEFIRVDGVWMEHAKLLPPHGVAHGRFGSAAAIDGDVAVIGSSGGFGNGEMTGTAVVFARFSGAWVAQATMQAYDGAFLDRFGSALTLDADTVIVGAWEDEDHGQGSGSAYVFRLIPDDDVPGTGAVGAVVLLLAVLVTGSYLARKRPTA
jgi:hypothetical protein